MFKQNCFIRKNTKELRSKLSSLDLNLNHGKAWGKCLCVFETEDSKEWRYVASPLSELEDMPNYKNSIDCGDNEDLFLAIAALSDDNNEHQWYTDGTRWCFNKLKPKYEWMIDDSWHKATVEELIEHFKNK